MTDKERNRKVDSDRASEKGVTACEYGVCSTRLTSNLALNIPPRPIVLEQGFILVV